MNDHPVWRAEISRKALHLTSSLAPLVYCFTTREQMLLMLTPLVIIAVVVEIARHLSPQFHAFFARVVGFMLRREEWPRVTGATYVLVAALICIYCFRPREAIAALFILSIADTAASLVGLRFGRTRFLKGTIAGSLAFFLVALTILFICIPGARGVGFATALVATIVEAAPTIRLGRLELNDNLTVPLVTGAVLHFLLRS